jgi:hypothetical protein
MDPAAYLLYIIQGTTQMLYKQLHATRIRQHKELLQLHELLDELLQLQLIEADFIVTPHQNIAPTSL